MSRFDSRDSEFKTKPMFIYASDLDVDDIRGCFVGRLSERRSAIRSIQQGLLVREAGLRQVTDYVCQSHRVWFSKTHMWSCRAVNRNGQPKLSRCGGEWEETAMGRQWVEILVISLLNIKSNSVLWSAFHSVPFIVSLLMPPSHIDLERDLFPFGICR